MSNILVIYDEDERYIEKLVQWLKQKNINKWEISCFTIWDNLVNYSKKKNITLLLLNETALIYDVNVVKAKLVILLQESKCNVSNNYKTIFKYQNVNQLIDELFSYENILLNNLTEKNKKYIGVYSPQDNWVRTPFSMLLSLFLAEKNKVYYLNLDIFSGYTYILEQDFYYDLIDAISYFDQGMLIEKLPQIIQKIKNVDFIPPIQNPEDIIHINVHKIYEMLELIDNYKKYDFVVIDIGNCILNPWNFFDYCEDIYVPILQEGYAIAKQNAFDTYLSAKGLNYVIQRMKKVYLPNLNLNKSSGMPYIGSILWGDLGEFMRTELKV